MAEAAVRPAPYTPAFPLRVATYVSTDFGWQTDLRPWAMSAEIVTLLAQQAWAVPTEKVHHLQDESGARVLDWFENLPQPGERDETLLLYFATHQQEDGTLRFSKGPPVPGKELVEAVNRLARQRRVIFLNDSCFAARLETCASFSPNVIRLHAADSNESSSEVRLRDGSPAGMDIFRSEREQLDARTGRRVYGASLFALLWLKSTRELTAENHPTITWKMLIQRMRKLRDVYDARVIQPHLQHLKVTPEGADFEMLHGQPPPA